MQHKEQKVITLSDTIRTSNSYDCIVRADEPPDVGRRHLRRDFEQP